MSLGYAGWSAGQLEQEIAQNAWLTVEADPDVMFDTAGRSAPARGDAPARHRFFAAVRRRRARVTLGGDLRRTRADGHRARVRFRHAQIGVAVGNTLDRRRASADHHRRGDSDAAASRRSRRWSRMAAGDCWSSAVPCTPTARAHAMTARARALRAPARRPLRLAGRARRTSATRPQPRRSALARRAVRGRASARRRATQVAAQLILQAWLDQRTRR